MAVGLHDRGVVAPGYRADLNLIDYAQLQLPAPEMVSDLPAGGKRLLQRAEGYVATIVRGQRLEAGPNAIEWDGRDEAGAPSPPGIYFVRAVVSGDEATVVRAITRLMPR